MTDFLLPVSISMGLLTYSLIARWYLVPWMDGRSRVEALTPILLLHGLRYVGLAFLIPGVTAAPLNPEFAIPAAYGDLIAAVLALAAILLLRQGLPGALSLVWVFNIWGTLDLLNALYKGFRLTPDGDLGATYFVPAVIVPALLVTHLLVFRTLLKKDSEPE
jgi:hypothetical protein